MTQPRRRIGVRTATFLVVASMVGTGVFTTSGLLLRDLRSVPAVMAAWALGGLLAMTGALCYAELVAALPENGGEYHLIGVSFHPSLGFATGFVSFIVGFSAPIAASAIAFGSYAHAIWPWVPVTPAALALVAAMCAVHAWRVGVGGIMQDALTAFKILLIALFVLVGAFGLKSGHLSYAEQPVLTSTLSPAFAISLIYVTFSYSGWNAATYIAGEMRDPQRSVPLALVLGTALVTALYLAVNLVFLGSAPAAKLSGVVEVGHVAAVAVLGERAGSALSAVIALGLISTVGALIMTGTRVLDAMGRDHRALAALARRSEGGAPFVAVGLLGLLASVMVLTASFDALLAYIGFTLSIFAALAVLGVVVMRFRRPDLPRPYRTFGYPFTPLVFVTLMVWMIVRSFFERPVVALAGGGTIALGLSLWLVLFALERRRAPEQAEAGSDDVEPP